MSTTQTAVPAKPKLWGTNRHFFAGFPGSLHHASIKAGGFSSKHHHANKFNMFYVVAGTLLVHFYPDATGPGSRTQTLRAGDKLTVEPGAWHRFEAVTDVELIELYCTQVDEDDIVRVDEGGVR